MKISKNIMEKFTRELSITSTVEFEIKIPTPREKI